MIDMNKPRKKEDHMPSRTAYSGHSLRVAEALAYYDLCTRALELGIPVSLNDPRSPKTVDALAEAVRKAEGG